MFGYELLKTEIEIFKDLLENVVYCLNLYNCYAHIP